MLRVKSFHRPQITNGSGTQINLSCDEYMGGTNNIVYLLLDGILETYMHHYGFDAGVCLSVLLLDPYYDDVTAPFTDDENAAEKFLAIAELAEERIVWECDKNELLAMVTLDEDDAESVAGTWLAHRRDMEEKAAGYQRMQEERLAAQFVDSLPTALRGQSRDLDPAKPDASVGLAIEFVP